MNELLIQTWIMKVTGISKFTIIALDELSTKRYPFAAA